MADLKDILNALKPYILRWISGTAGMMGWVDVSWLVPVYASATTITLDGDQTGIFKIGLRVRFKQTTYKYGVLSIDSTYSAGTGKTTITFIANNDYSVANAAISEMQISFMTPVDWPGWFNWTPTWTATSSPAIGNGTLYGRYSVVGRMCQFMISMNAGSTTTFGSGNWAIGLPVPVSSSALVTDVLARARDSGTASYGFFGFLTASGSTLSGLIDLSQFINTVYWTASYPFSWGNGDSFVINGRYEI